MDFKLGTLITSNNVKMKMIPIAWPFSESRSRYFFSLLPRGISVLQTSCYSFISDTNECENSPCTHSCINTHGGYECQCPSGYYLEDLHTCKGNHTTNFDISIIS